MATVKGLDSFFDVVAVLSDPAKFQAKAEELQKMINDYTVVIESVVKLSEVNDYTVNIKKSKEEAEKELAAARDEATSIKEKAAQAAANKMKTLEETEDKLNVRQADLNKRDVTMQEKMAGMIALEKELADKAIVLDEKATKLAALELDLAERKAKLLAAMK
jgi:lipopolysaccharide export LptBFGC system permease protein LptF